MLVCLSQKYKESAGCRRDCQFAIKAQKRLIPLLVEPEYTPEGWLELIVDETDMPKFEPGGDNQASVDAVSRELGKLLVNGKSRIAGGVWHQLHNAADAGDSAQVAKLLHTGGERDEDATQSSAHPSIQPLHRAARGGHVEVGQVLLEAGAVVNAQLEPSKMTAFHVACDAGRPKFVDWLVDEARCDTELKSGRGKTGWDLARRLSSVESVILTDDLQRSRSAVPCGEIDLSLQRRATLGAHDQLAREHKSRQSRPDVHESFMEQQFQFDRLIFWALLRYANWTWLAEGGFGEVYRVSHIFPALEIGGGEHDVSQLAIKAAKQDSQGQLKGEIKELTKLSHPNIVRIYGFCLGTPKGSSEDSWMMALECVLRSFR